MMALAWADRKFKPAPAFEFQLWREATTIVSSSGPGGCEPYGMAVALKRHGLTPEIYVSRPPPYFLETTMAADRRRAMEFTQGAHLQLGGGVGGGHQRRHRAQLVAEVVRHEQGVVAEVLGLAGQVRPRRSGRSVAKLDAEAEASMRGPWRRTLSPSRLSSPSPHTPVCARTGVPSRVPGAPDDHTTPSSPLEQAYLDRAYAHLARMRARTEAGHRDRRQRRPGGRLGHRPGAPATRRLRSLDTEVDGLAFGRLDAEDGDTWYVGRRHVEDERGDPVVVDWRAPVSTPFYRATAADPLELRAPAPVPDDGAPASTTSSTRCSTTPTASTPPTTAASPTRCSPSSSGPAPARCATSSPRSRPSRTW